MRRFFPRWSLLLLSSSLVLAPASLYADDRGRPGPPAFTRSEIVRFLTTARVVKQKELSTGVTNSLRASLTDGRITHDAHVQTIDEARPYFRSIEGTELNFRDSYKYNIAAYRLDQLLELNMVPCSVERKFKGKTGAFTWWVDEVLMTELQRYREKMEPPDLEAWDRQLYAVRVFDQLIYNMDRNLGNLLITKDWKVWMIDHTRAFRKHRKLKNPKALLKCDRKLLAKLRELDEETLKQELGAYLTNGEIRGLLARRDAIVKHFDEQTAKQGETEVLYDLNRD